MVGERKRDREEEEEEEHLTGLIPNDAKKKNNPETGISARLSPNEADAASLPSS